MYPCRIKEVCDFRSQFLCDNRTHVAVSHAKTNFRAKKV